MRDQLVGTTDVVHGRDLGLINAKNKRHADFKYDKVGYFEMQTEESWKGLPNGTSSVNIESDAIQEHSVSPIVVLEQDIKDIKAYLKAMEDRNSEKELKERISKEWRLIALVFDRLFFFLYLLAITVSICTVFENALFETS